MSSSRVLAARLIDEVTQGRSLSDMAIRLDTLKEARDKALVQAIVYGVCRFYTRLDVMLSHLLQKPMKEKDSDVHALLLVGLYQLWAMRLPAYAAVTETVKGVESLKKPWARGLINAVLREYLRKQEQIEQWVQADEEAFYAHPQWWITALKEAWPEHWQALLIANNEHPTMTLRVNEQKISRDDYLEQLRNLGFAAHSLPGTNQGIRLEKPVPAETLPGFAAGEVSVQDGGAQLAAQLLPIKSADRILDACAAPGGKLLHLLEKQNDLQITALEKNRTRWVSLNDTLTRSNQQVRSLCVDAAEVSTWWDGQLFDHILLDAPCSGSGVIRRHPDIKLLRQPQDIPAFAQEQHRLLHALWPLLKPGGSLLYVTCSIFPAENAEVIQQFLMDHQDATAEKITLAIGQDCHPGHQILPGEQDMDGFYYALLRKV